MRRYLIPLLVAAIGCVSPQKASSIEVRRGAGTVYTLSKEAGEQALHQLAKRARLEDYWIFSNGLWVDIGVKELPEGVRGDGSVFQQFASDPLIEYHIHPRSDECIYPPSATDIIRHGLLKKALRKNSISLESKVYDGHGEWAYTVSKDVETFLDLKNIKMHGRTFEELLREILANTSEIFTRDGDRPRDELIQRYIQKVKDFGVYLEYRKLR